MRSVDLHIHTTASDGAYAPAEVVELARQAGLDCIAITDHDSVEGVAAAREAGAACGVHVVSGVELNTLWSGQSVHILGYGVDEGGQELQEVIARQRDGRRWRAQQMVERLAHLGMPVPWERVLALAEGGAIGRPHLARALVEAGYVATTEEAFDRYLGHGKPAYVEQPKLTPQEAIALLHRNGAAAGLAHPFNIEGTDQPDLTLLIPELVAAGLDAVEVYYTGYTAAQQQILLAFAERYGLIPTGGSDFHGGGVFPQAVLGAVHVPVESLARLAQISERIW